MALEDIALSAAADIHTGAFRLRLFEADLFGVLTKSASK
jgi:hypothetical protein